MSEKREGPEDAYGFVLQGPHDKAKAKYLDRNFSARFKFPLTVSVNPLAVVGW